MHYADLTPIERAIFDLITDDYTVQEIAYALNLSIAAVQTAIKSLKQKLSTQ